MAIEFNVTEAHEFFLGEDKFIDLAIFDEDEVTPLDVTGMSLEWNMRKKDNSPDPPLLVKQLSNGTLSIIGTYNINPAINTQRVRLKFVPADTWATPQVIKAHIAYRHSLKRLDSTMKNILSYGSITFMQATERS
jgi:hypothetical protein